MALHSALRLPGLRLLPSTLLLHATPEPQRTSCTRLAACINCCLLKNSSLLQGFNSPTNRKDFHNSASLAKGHSKWQNIQHVKGARDKALASAASSLAKELNTCLTRNPNPDPKLNTGLAALIQKARKNQISNDVIARAIDRAVKSKDPKSITAFDARGPANTGIIVECFSPNPKHSKTQIQGIVKRFGFSVMNSAEDLFRRTGYVAVTLPEAELEKAKADPENFNVDEYIDIAIEVGAEDVTLEPGAEGPFLQFECHFNDVGKVQRALEEAGHTVESGEALYVAVSPVPVSPDFLDSVSKLSDKLELYPEFIKFYSNVVPED